MKLVFDSQFNTVVENLLVVAMEANPLECNFYENSYSWFLNNVDCGSFTTIYYVLTIFTLIFVVCFFLTCIFNTLWIKHWIMVILRGHQK